MSPDDDNLYLDGKELSRVLLWTLAMFILSLFAGSLLILLGGPKWGLLAETLFIIPAILYVLKRKLPFRRTFRLNPVTLPILFCTLLLAIPVMILGDELDRIIALFFPLPSWFDVGDLLAIDSLTDALLIIGNGVVVAAIAEEMLFRGLVQRTLEHLNEAATAMALSAILFAMFHFNIWWMIQITLLGLVLAYITWKSGSIWPAVMLHGLNNLLSILVNNAGPEKLSWYAGEVHVKWIWIAAALILLFPALSGFHKACDTSAAARLQDRMIGEDHE
ncbi:MAG TPA: type II CAAX endopeptidase family protein [bacterium]|nr:type II CAAX endopeptidase family protein [bacterium]HQG44634.1 type II CAAX endopeptidase family protein [bacterium]HQI49593.1 type II CAAX endopeptidase family protein [bacterium]HQJ63273.1 type II CAAX endopeptidase family protein [bacterium]